MWQPDYLSLSETLRDLVLQLVQRFAAGGDVNGDGVLTGVFVG